MHSTPTAMRYYDEENPKKPMPVRGQSKNEGHAEAQEHSLRKVRKDLDRDHHRHVC